MDFVLDAGHENVTVALDILGEVVEVCYLDSEGARGASSLPDNFSLPINPISINLDMEKARPFLLSLLEGQEAD